MPNRSKSSLSSYHIALNYYQQAPVSVIKWPGTIIRPSLYWHFASFLWASTCTWLPVFDSPPLPKLACNELFGPERSSRMPKPSLFIVCDCSQQPRLSTMGWHNYWRIILFLIFWLFNPIDFCTRVDAVFVNMSLKCMKIRTIFKKQKGWCHIVPSL